MKIFVCILAVIAAATAGTLPNGGIGSYSLAGLDQTAYNLNGLSPNSGGYILSGQGESAVQSVNYPSEVGYAGGVGDSQTLARILQILCPDQIQGLSDNVQLVQSEPNQEFGNVQYLQSGLQQGAELNNFQIVNQAAQPASELSSYQYYNQQSAPEPEVRYVKLVSQEAAPVPEVNYLQLVNQAPAPAPEVRTVQLIREQPAPPPQIRTVQLIRDSPQANTLQFLTEAGESSGLVESNVQIQQDLSGAQTLRFLQEGGGGEVDGSYEKLFKIIRS